jgi:fructose-specific phosphotransferase system IIC component
LISGVGRFWGIIMVGVLIWVIAVNSGFWGSDKQIMFLGFVGGVLASDILGLLGDILGLLGDTGNCLVFCCGIIHG